MSAERTLAIIKPDAVSRNLVGEMLSAIALNGFRILAMRMLHLTRREAEGFYVVHRGKPFFEGLVGFMSEGPVVVMALEREDAIRQWRELMGATNPANASEGTLRKRFAADIQHNCVHGSDAPETAVTEIAYFFSGIELI